MDIFARLRTETLLAGMENELPDYLAERLLAIADHPQCYPDAREEILQLIDMLPLYDTYGQTGYIGMGVSNLIIEGVLRRVEAKREAATRP
ncbi:MAG: GSU3529 family protein [Desulfuromonadales bacterium]